MRRGILITALLVVCGAARAFDAAPLLPWITEHTDDPYLVAWYKLDGNALDSSASRYDGTGYNVSYGSGQIDQAAQFNGTNAYVGVDDSLGAFSAYTATAWIRYAGGGGGSAGRPFFFESAGGYAISGEVVPSTMQVRAFVQFSDLSTSSVLSGVGSITANEWAHVAVLFSSNSYLRVHVNGVLSGANNALSSSLGTANATMFRIGTYRQKDNRWWSGSIDDVRIYNRALSSNDVSRIYQGLTPLHD